MLYLLLNLLLLMINDIELLACSCELYHLCFCVLVYVLHIRCEISPSVFLYFSSALVKLVLKKAVLNDIQSERVGLSTQRVYALYKI